MKNLITLFVSFAFITSSIAQTDIKVNPFGLLWTSFDVGLEFGIGENFGLEPRLIYDYDDISWLSDDGDRHRYGIILEGKYYFNTDLELSGWHAGMYTKFLAGTTTFPSSPNVNSTRLALGFLFGYKYVSPKNVIFEVGFGFGRAAVNRLESEDDSVDLDDFPILNLDFTGKLAIGYRFRPNSSTDQQERRRRKG